MISKRENPFLVKTIIYKIKELKLIYNLSSGLSEEDLKLIANKLGMKKLAITDLENLFNLI